MFFGVLPMPFEYLLHPFEVLLILCDTDVELHALLPMHCFSLCSFTVGLHVEFR